MEPFDVHKRACGSALDIFGAKAPKWVFHPNAPSDGWAHHGWHSSFADTEDTEKWVVVDLGRTVRIEAVRLIPLFPYHDGVAIAEWRVNGVFFPRALRVDVADAPSFDTYTQVATWVDPVDRPGADSTPDGDFLGWHDPHPLVKPITLAFAPRCARYVRLTAMRLDGFESIHDAIKNGRGKRYALALSGISVFGSADPTRDLARGSAVTVSDSLSDTPRFAPEYLVDGREASLPPATCLRREFAARGEVRSAELLATARGMYQCRLNGKPVGPNRFPPEWTDYDSRLMVQRYDVTSLLKADANALAVVVGDGWLFGIRPGGQEIEHPYGFRHQFLAALDIQYANGRVERLITDDSWRVSTDGPWRQCDLYLGEIYDARREWTGWEQAGYDGAVWATAATDAHDWQPLAIQEHPPIVEARAHSCVAVSEPSPGVHVLDFGVNLLGACRLRLRGLPGSPITARHAQNLRPDGTVDAAGNGWELQLDTLIPAHAGMTEWSPTFTAHGFRYVELRGLATPPAPSDAEALHFQSACEEVGDFTSSSDILNRVTEAARQTLRSNKFGFSTDSAARERVGWPTCAEGYSADLYLNRLPDFYRNVVRNMTEFFVWNEPGSDGEPAGMFNILAPFVYAFRQGLPRTGARPGKEFAFAWADAILPLSLHLHAHYGDARFIKEPYPHVQALMRLLEKIGPQSLDEPPSLSSTFGDWLDARTFFAPLWQELGAAVHPPAMRKLYWVDDQLLAYAYMAHDFDLAAQYAERIGNPAERDRWRERFAFLRDYFERHFVRDDGRLKSHTQAAYALSLGFDLVPEERRPSMLKHLDWTLDFTGGRPTTGFVTTPLLLKTLSRFGRHARAVDLMLATRFPSFGYMVEHGATTIWERWDTDRWQGKQFMNDHNHRDFCGFVDWIWQCLVGLRPDSKDAGFRHFIVAPQLDERLSYVRARHLSLAGPIEIHWRIEGQRRVLDVTVPKDTRATVHFAGRAETVGAGLHTFSDDRTKMPAEEEKAIFTTT